MELVITSDKVKSARQVAKELNLTPMTVIRAIRQGRLTAVKGSAQFFVVVGDEKWQKQVVRWERLAPFRARVSEAQKRRWQKAK